jgi:hypothetical protein
MEDMASTVSMDKIIVKIGKISHKNRREMTNNLFADL